MIRIIFIISLIFTLTVFPQEKTDSLNLDLRILSTAENLDKLTEKFLIEQPLSFDLDIPVTSDENSIWLWTSAVLSNANKHDFHSASPHMLANYHQFYIENSKFKIINTVLGAAQLGAVGFMAYKHIKKYGFK